MNPFIRLLLVSILMIVAAPAFSGSVVHVLNCEIDEEATRAELIAVASKWLKSAKEVKGGDQLKIHLDFPRAAHMGEYDFNLILMAPSFEAWGTFMDGYEGSAASETVDKEWDELADCPDSSLWESVKVE